VNATFRRQRRSFLRRKITAFAALAFCAIVASSLQAQLLLASPNSSSVPSVQYRRVFVPADRTADWPIDGAQYLPIERSEFERLVQQTEDRRQLGRAGGVQVASAEYTAKLTEGDALAGVAKLHLRLIGDSPAVVSLEPWNAIVKRARWLSDDPSAEPSSATVGLWLGADGQPDRYGLLADRAGEVEFDWQAAPEQPGANLEFSIHLPSAVSQRFTIDLSAGATPRISSGRLVEQTVISQGTGRRWTFQLAGGVEHKLEISRPATAAPDDPSVELPLVAMSEAYHLTTDGADYEAELRIQERGVPPSELRLTAPPALHISVVTVNRQPVEWRRDPEDAAALLIPLPAASKEATGVPITVSIGGAAPVTFDAAWKLPSVAPQGLFWTEGTSTLWVDPSLEIRSFTPRECSLLNVVGVGSGDAGEVYRLQAWSPAAAADLIIGDRRKALRHRTGAIAEFADREILARMRCVVWGEGARTFHIATSLADDWNIESVTAIPADGVVEWHVEEGVARKLHLQLRRSPSEQMPLTVSVSARKPWRAWTRMASLDDLNFLQFPGGSSGQWLFVKDRRGNEIVPDARLAEAVATIESIPFSVQEFLGDVAQGLLIDLSKANPNTLVSVASAEISFSGEGWMEVAAAETGYEHRAEILCRPASGVVSDLRMFASRELPTEAIWELDDGQPLVVERTSTVSSAPASTPAAPKTAVNASTSPNDPIEYRVRLPQPRTSPFRIRAAWRSMTPVDAAVNLLSLPDAETWQAWAIFRGQAAEVAVDPRGAVSAFAFPNKSSTIDGQLPALACYRLGDDPAASPDNLPTFIAQPTANDASSISGAVAWHCDVETQQFADGTQKHRLNYQIEARQPTDVQLELPSDAASFTSVSLDGRAITSSLSPDARNVRFRLPGSPLLQTLVVALERKILPLGRGASTTAALPRTSFPVLRGKWTLHWPAAYNAASLAAPAQSPNAAAEPASWLARLCGPLSGHSGQSWYDGMLLAHVEDASPIMPASAAGGVTSGGWSTLAQPYVSRPAPVQLRLASSDQANWHVSWLVAAVAAGWLWARSRRAVSLIVAAVAALCLVVPESFIPLPQAVFLGLLTGAFVRQFVSFLTKARSAAGSRPRLIASSVAMLLLAAMFLNTSSTALAQPSGSLMAPEILAASELNSTSVNPAPQKIPSQVLFPVNIAGQPVGADVYVPAAMVAELLPVEQDFSSAVLTDAQYQVELQSVVPSGDIVARRVQLRFRWQSRRPQARVELPLVAADGAIDSSSLLLDGQPLLPVWNAAGTALAIILPQAGPHELTAALTPLAAAPAVDDVQRARLQFHIPALAGANVEVLHPAGLADIRAAAAVPAAGQSNAARTTFQLGSTKMLDLSWPARLEREATGVTAEQLSILEVDPAGARLEVRLRLAGEAGSVNTLRLAASPQLKLLPLPEGSPLEAAPVNPSDPSTPGVIALRFRTPPMLPLTLALQFQLQRTTSVGRIDYPWIEILGMNVRSRHFAVAADPRLRIRDAATSGLAPIASVELEPLWGPAAAAASLQYAVARAMPDWSLDVSPAPSRFTSRESLELYCGENEVRVAYAAGIAEVAGEILVHRLIVSPDLKVEHVAAALDGPEGVLPVRWSRPQPDQIHVFLSRPLSEPHTLRVEGRVKDVVNAAPVAGAASDAGLPSTVERKVRVPRIALEATQATPIDVALFRADDALVDWASAPPQLKPVVVAVSSAKGLFVGQFTLPRGGDVLPELRIVHNDAQYDADALLTLQLETAEATATCQLHGRVARGIVDRLQLIVDKNWRGPFTCEPAARVLIRDLAADSDRHLLDVHLARPIPAGEAFNVAIRGPVSLEDDQRVRFPTLRLANAQRQRTYLILPPTAGNLTAEWTLRGLQSQTLPEPLATQFNLPLAQSAYSVERERFVAEQRVFPDAMRSAVYRLAETRVDVDLDGRALALSQLIVQAGGGEECRVSFPAGAEIQYIAVDGVAQDLLPASEAPWQAPVGSRFLPRVFQFIYRLPKFAPHVSHRFDPPKVTIDGKLLPPRVALWKIADAGAHLTSSTGAKTTTDVEFAAVARREQIDAFLDAYPLASQLAEWELQLWRQPWFDRLNAGKIAAAADDPAAWTRLRDRLLTSAASSRAEPVSPISHWSDGFSTYSTAFQGDADGSITLTPAVVRRPIARWVAAIALAAAVGVAWRQPAALRRLTLPMKRWPYVALAIAGLLWWYYLSPSLVGLFIIAFAIAAYRKSRS
jgi:hypothetical protein